LYVTDIFVSQKILIFNGRLHNKWSISFLKRKRDGYRYERIANRKNRNIYRTQSDKKKGFGFNNEIYNAEDKGNMEIVIVLNKYHIYLITNYIVKQLQWQHVTMETNKTIYIYMNGNRNEDIASNKYKILLTFVTSIFSSLMPYAKVEKIVETEAGFIFE